VRTYNKVIVAAYSAALLRYFERPARHVNSVLSLQEFYAHLLERLIPAGAAGVPFFAHEVCAFANYATAAGFLASAESQEAAGRTAEAHSLGRSAEHYVGQIPDGLGGDLAAHVGDAKARIAALCEKVQSRMQQYRLRDCPQQQPLETPALLAKPRHYGIFSLQKSADGAFMDDRMLFVVPNDELILYQLFPNFFRVSDLRMRHELNIHYLERLAVPEWADLYRTMNEHFRAAVYNDRILEHRISEFLNQTPNIKVEELHANIESSLTFWTAATTQSNALVDDNQP
jgi:hypothetical protein